MTNGVKLLAEHGLQVEWSQEKPESASGIGGVTKPIGVVYVPVGLAGCNGLIRFTVVEQDVPPLLPVGIMRTLQASLDLTDDGDKVIFRQFGGESSLRTLQSGHTVIRADQIDPDGWQLPEITELCQNNDEGRATIYMSVIAHAYQRPRGMDDDTPAGDHDPASTRSCRPRQKTTSNGDGSTRSHLTNPPTTSPRLKSGKQTHGAFQNHERYVRTSPRLRPSTDRYPVERQQCDVLRTMRAVWESVVAHSPDHGETESRDEVEQSHSACVHREATGRDRTPLLSTRTREHDDAGHAAAEPLLGMLDVQYHLRTQPGRVRCSTCRPWELRGCRREHGSHWGRRDTVPLKVQWQLKGVDQEVYLLLIYETGQRPENQIATLGLVLRQTVESGEQVTGSFKIPEGFLNWMVLDSQPTKSVSRRVRMAIERNIDDMCPETKSPVKNATRESGCKERWNDTTFARSCLV